MTSIFTRGVSLANCYRAEGAGLFVWGEIMQDEYSRSPQGMARNDCKEAHQRVEYLEHRIARKLCRIEGVQSKAAFMVDLFGRHGPKELQRLSMIYPEVMK